MADIINLRMARKARDRAQAEQTAATNRARFGRTRAQRLADEQDAIARQRIVDGAKRERPED